MARPKNALIIDDESHVRVYLKLVLGELGIEEFWEAADGETALDIVALQRPDLVLLDLNLPRLDGMGALRRLRESHPLTPVIIVTSQNSASTVLACQKLGAIGYVLKQSPRAQLLSNLSEAIDSLSDSE